jgi:predicted DNA-binding protein (MmcQ/YjbR family)
MDGETLQQHARDRVEELPGAGLEYPFGPDWDVFKVRDKVFMLMTEDCDRQGRPGGCESSPRAA